MPQKLYAAAAVASVTSNKITTLLLVGEATSADEVVGRVIRKLKEASSDANILNAWEIEITDTMIDAYVAQRDADKPHPPDYTGDALDLARAVLRGSDGAKTQAQLLLRRMGKDEPTATNPSRKPECGESHPTLRPIAPVGDNAVDTTHHEDCQKRITALEYALRCVVDELYILRVNTPETPDNDLTFHAKKLLFTFMHDRHNLRRLLDG